MAVPMSRTALRPLRRLRPRTRCLTTTSPSHAQGVREALKVPTSPLVYTHEQPTSATPRTIPTCPPPTLPHAPKPPDLDIDRKLPLLGSMPAHHGHVLIATGRTDWKSRVEDDEATEGGVIKGLKEMLGPRGMFANVRHGFIHRSRCIDNRLTADSHSTM